MSGLWVPDSGGTYHLASAVYYADDEGTYQPAGSVYAADSSGTFRLAYPYGPVITSFTFTPSSSAPWTAATLNWLAASAVRYELYLPDVSPTPVFSGTGTSYTFHGAPGSSTRFRLRAYDVSGNFIDSTVLTGRLANLPAPQNFRVLAHDSSSITWGWDSVAGIDAYELDNAGVFGFPMVWTGTATSVRETGLSANTVYSRAIRSRAGFAFSSWSSTLNQRTTATGGPPPDVYQIPASSAHAYAPGYGTWRPASDGVIHGNGDNWGGANGNQITLFTYSQAALHALAGGRVTRFKVRIHRDSSSGFSSPQLCHWGLGHDLTLPAGAPSVGTSVDAGSLGWGNEELIDLPVSWGQALVDGTLGAASITWGGVAGRYMRGPQEATQGQLYITIG